MLTVCIESVLRPRFDHEFWIVASCALLVSPERNCAVHSLTLAQVYDYVLTLDREATFIWPSPMSVTKVLFLLTRYAPFIDIGMIIWRER